MVESQMDDTPVYSVVQMTPGSTSRILHRNMLHPARSIRTEDADIPNETQDVTQSAEEESISALAKANVLMDMSYFVYACKTKGKNGISHLISETA